MALTCRGLRSRVQGLRFTAIVLKGLGFGVQGLGFRPV